MFKDDERKKNIKHGVPFVVAMALLALFARDRIFGVSPVVAKDSGPRVSITSTYDGSGSTTPIDITVSTIGKVKKLFCTFNVGGNDLWVKSPPPTIDAPGLDTALFNMNIYPETANNISANGWVSYPDTPPAPPSKRSFSIRKLHHDEIMGTIPVAAGASCSIDSGTSETVTLALRRTANLLFLPFVQKSK